MRKNNGITLISLVITVTVLIILASIATYSGVNVIRQSKLNRFITEMKIMQTEVNSLYDKYSNGTDEEKADILNSGKALDSEASNVFTTNASGITDSSGYKYYDKTTIETLGIENVEEEFYVNVSKRSVISRLGIEYEGEKYYTLEQVPSGLYNVEYENRNTEKPTFDITKEKLENGKYKITISNIQYDGYIEKWEVKYRLQGESNWSTSEDLSFIVSKNGTYEIKLVNGSVESEEKEVEASKETIDETTSYVANYLDIDYDEEADGIIYADLAVGRSGQWIDSSGIYSYEAKKGLKEYYIENENYVEEKFGDVRGKLIAPAKGSSGEERFFIMALDDIKSGTRFCWYDAAYGKLDKKVEESDNDFGKGKENTAYVMNKFDLGESEGGWGKQNDNGTYDDMWGVDELRSKVNEGWFVASKSEWAAFGDVVTELGVRMDNYDKYGLSEWYWSSSQIFTYGAYYTNFFEWCLNYDFVSSNGFVRLSAIF